MVPRVRPRGVERVNPVSAGPSRDAHETKMRAMSRMLSAKRASRETPRTSANGRDALASLEQATPRSTGDDASGLASARDGDDRSDTRTREDHAADAARLAARLAETEARVLHLENQLERASARAAAAEQRASAAEQRERAAFHERAAASADPGMPRPPRWLVTDEATDAATDAATAPGPETASPPVPARGGADVPASRERVAASDARTRTERVAEEDDDAKRARARDPELRLELRPALAVERTASAPRRAPAATGARAPSNGRTVPRLGDASVGDARADLARARRAARQSGDKERAMVAQLNAYRRAKDQSEARVRELAAELAEAARDSRAWQSQARRVAVGVADAKDALMREASTPRAGSLVGDGDGDADALSDARSDCSASDSGDDDDDDDDAREGGRKNADDHQVFRRIRRGRVADVAALLRSRSVNPDVRDRFGNTPLIVAAQNDRKRISKLIVKAGANLNAANAEGNAALHYCYAYGHFDLAEFLERRGADVSVRNEAGIAPRDVLEGDADARARWCAAKRDAETRRARAEARRRQRESVAGFAGDSDDGFGTDAEAGFETSDDESDGTPRRDAARRDASSSAHAVDEDACDDDEGGLRSYRALVSGGGRDDARRVYFEP